MKVFRIFLLGSVLALMAGCAPEPVANFEYSSDNYSAPAEVSFTNLSSDAESYRWEFGDGKSSNEANPTHIFETPGTFTVTLLAKGSGGESNFSSSIVIEQATSYLIKNQLSITLYDVLSFYWDGANILEDVDHGNMVSGAVSSEVYTQYLDINIFFEVADGTQYLSTYPFNLTVKARNTINISGESLFSEVTATRSIKSYSPEELGELRKSGRRVMVKDIR